jgi:hypothetical protein
VVAGRQLFEVRFRTLFSYLVRGFGGLSSPPLTSTIARLTIQTTPSSASSGIVEFHNAVK